MASTLKVNTIQHTGGTSAVSIDSAGQVSLPNTTMIQQWQLTSDNGANDATLTPFALSTLSTQTNSMVGPSMTHSSGVFTFPKTGLYRVTMDMMGLNGGGSQDNYINVRINLSTDSGGSYSIIKEVISGGVSSIEDIKKAKTLKNVEGVIVGKAIYDGDIKLEELAKEDA